MRGICFNACVIVKNNWHKYSDEKPEYGKWVIAYHHLWINEDFNPEGIRIGFITDNLAQDAPKNRFDFCSAHWWDYQDCYVTISKIEIEGREQEFSQEILDSIEPEFWTYAPLFKQADVVDVLKLSKDDTHYLTEINYALDNYYDADKATQLLEWIKNRIIK